MSDLEKLIDQTHKYLPEGYKIEINPDDGYKLLKTDSIVTEEGVEDEWVATIHNMDTFMEFISFIGTRNLK